MPNQKRVIALRLDDETLTQLEKIAEEDSRSLANLAEIFVRKGIRDYLENGGWPVVTGSGTVTYVRASPALSPVAKATASRSPAKRQPVRRRSK